MQSQRRIRRRVNVSHMTCLCPARFAPVSRVPCAGAIPPLLDACGLMRPADLRAAAAAALALVATASDHTARLLAACRPAAAVAELLSLRSTDGTGSVISETGGLGASGAQTASRVASALRTAQRLVDLQARAPEPCPPLKIRTMRAGNFSFQCLRPAVCAARQQSPASPRCLLPVPFPLTLTLPPPAC